MNLIEAKTWADEMDVRVTVCDLDAVIVYMNEASVEGFQKYGGAELLGKSLFDCHLPVSQEKIMEMLEHPRVNTYLIKKNQERRLIRQFPWIEKGEHRGVIEISFELPDDFEEKKR